MEKRNRHIGKRVARALGVLVVAMVLVIAVPNAVELCTQRPNVVSQDEVVASGQSYDAILVLGASVNPDGTPSEVLRDRLDVAVSLYRAGVAPKVIMSGDNFSDAEHYNEVSIMKDYAVAQGIPSEDVFCDHAGICTYDSMYRAQYVFKVKTMVVVTQEYHLFRALYDANHLGMEAMGVASDLHGRSVQSLFNPREVFARMSDFAKVWTRANATYLSEEVPLDQSGDVTTW